MSSPGRRIAERPTSRRPRRSSGGGDRPRPARSLLVGLWLILLLLGLAALVAEMTGIGPGSVPEDWLGRIGAVAVSTTYAWALAVRTNGLPAIAVPLALGLGVVTLAVGGAVLDTGAAVLTCSVGGVLAVLATVPAAGYLQAAREAVVATLVAAGGGLAALGFEPSVVEPRFQYATLLLGLALVLGLVYRLGAGLHGLGRRGLIALAVGAVVLVVTLAYAELLRRYGVEGIVDPVLAVVRWSRETLGAFPRPLVVLLGIPALVWGAHMRARRRQGWWVCAYGVAATVPVAQTVVDPTATLREAGLEIAYGVLLGVLVGWLLIRIDLALTGSPGPRGGRRADAAPPAVQRPEPSRTRPL